MAEIDLHLYREDDDAEDRACKDIFYALVAGTLSPHAAASQLDGMIREKANERFNRISALEKPDLEDLESSGQMPNPDGDIWEVWDLFSKAAKHTPTDHPGQDHLVQMISALSSLPVHDVPQKMSKKIQMWNNIGELGFIRLGQWLWEMSEHYQVGDYRALETDANREQEQREWRNYQSFLARLTASGLLNCIGTSALVRGFSDEKRSAPYQIEGHVLAASEWIQKAGRFVYGRCKGDVKEGETRSKFETLEQWALWKRRFSYVNSHEGCSVEARKTARETVELMDAAERVDV